MELLVPPLDHRCREDLQEFLRLADREAVAALPSSCPPALRDASRRGSGRWARGLLPGVETAGPSHLQGGYLPPVGSTFHLPPAQVRLSQPRFANRFPPRRCRQIHGLWNLRVDRPEPTIRCLHRMRRHPKPAAPPARSRLPACHALVALAWVCPRKRSYRRSLSATGPSWQKIDVQGAS
jgi:hypothetical protein